MTWVFAGRADDLRRCVTLGESQAHLAVFGGRGVGTSRFLTELAAQRDAGRRIHELAASEVLREVPFGALSPLLAPAVTGDVDGFGVGSDAVTRAIQSVARQVRHRPTTIVIDDAHRLDPLSIEVLVGLVDRSALDLRLVVAVDPGRSIPARLGEVWTGGTGATHELASMTVDAFTEMLKAQDPAVPDERCRELHHWCAGLPLLAHERLMCDTPDDLAAAADSRMIAAVERVLDLADEGERTIVEFLSFTGSVSRFLLASSEPILAGLERRRIVTDDDHEIALRVPLVGAAISTTVGNRRRWALYSFMVARFRDTLPTSGPDLVALTLWDARGTRVLPVRETVRGARRALDDGQPDLAHELLESVEHRRSPSAGFDVLLLEAELAATTDTDQASRQLAAAMRSAESRDDRDAVLTSIAAVFRRGALPADVTSDLLALARVEATAAEQRRIDLLAAEMGWLRGDVRRAAEVLASRPDREQSVPDRESQRMLRVAMAVESAGAGAARRAVTTFRRTVRSSTSRAAMIVDVGAGLCDLLLEPLDTIILPRDAERRLHPERWVARCAVAAISGFSSGDLDAARAAAGRVDVSTGSARRGLGALAPIVDRLADPQLNPSSTQGRRPGERTEWWWWGRLLDAWIDLVASPSNTTADELERSIGAASRAGACAVVTIGSHVLHRFGRSESAEAMLRSHSLDGVDSPIVHAIDAAVTARRAGDHGEQMDAASRLARLGWRASAGDDFAAVAAAERRSGESWHSRLVAELAARRCAAAVDGRSLLGAPQHDSLMTSREHEVVWSIADGATSRAAARRLDVSVRTIDNQLHRIYRRFDLAGRSELVDCCRRAAELVAPPVEISDP